MDTSKLSRYDWVVVAGMILLFIALFLTWYRVEILQRLLQELQGGLNGASVDTSGFSVNGWHYVSAVLAWLLTVVATAVVILKALPAVSVRLPLPESFTVMALGAIAFLLVLYRLIAMPAPSEAFGRGAGIFVALLATFLVAAGGFLKNAEPR
jgi:heme/copper-type cytochrome/quinol oxidase subunit 4